MVKVKGSTGKEIEVEIEGVAQVIQRINKFGHTMEFGADQLTGQVAIAVQNEVIESVMGRRSEPRSVRTGLFINTIKSLKEDHADWIVKNLAVNYPRSKTKTTDVARWLEWGTSRINARRHYSNSKARAESSPKVKKMINDYTKRGIASFNR